MIYCILIYHQTLCQALIAENFNFLSDKLKIRGRLNSVTAVFESVDLKKQ